MLERVLVDANGKIVGETKVASEPQALIAWVGSLGFGLERIGLEAGPLSQWLFAGMGDVPWNCWTRGTYGRHSRPCRSSRIATMHAASRN